MPVTVPAGQPTIVNPSNNISTLRNAAPAAPQDPTGAFMQQYLGILNSPGQFGPGSGGTAGYTTDNSAQRAASQAGYNQAVANAKDVYGQAVGMVTARDPGIQQSYSDATAAIQANARQRAIDDMSRQQTLQQQAIQGAQALGLSGVASPSATTRTNALAAAQQAKYQTNADAWAGFNGGAAQRAVAKNDAVANGFTNSGAQAQNALAALLQKTLASEANVYHPGKGGSAGKFIGLTPQQQLAGYGNLLNYGLKGQTLGLNVSKAQNSAQNNTVKNNLAAAVAKARFGATPSTVLPSQFLN